MFNGTPDSIFEFTNSADLCDYLFGGNGVVTLESPSGKHRTYKVTLPRNDEFPDGTYFVYAQSNHTGDWFYVGMISAEHEFRRTTHSWYPKDHEIFKGADYLYRMMEGYIKSTPMKVYHCGVCSVCGRKLTTPESIMKGMGPKCRKKSNAERRQLAIQRMGEEVQR